MSEGMHPNEVLALVALGALEPNGVWWTDDAARPCKQPPLRIHGSWELDSARCAWCKQLPTPSALAVIRNRNKEGHYTDNFTLFTWFAEEPSHHKE